MVIKRLVVMLTVLAASGLACAAAQPAAAADAVDYPAPIEAMRMQGVQIVGTFDVPGDMIGYAGIVGRRSIAIYLTADKQHAVVGYMIDGTGTFVDQATVHDMTAGPMAEQIWTQLEHSDWVAEGSSDAPRVIYEFSDPNCPYCHVFWKRVQPWVDAGQVEVRHVMVGVIAADSPNKAATIFAAEDPGQAFVTNQQQFAAGGVEPMAEIPADILSKIMSNQQLMSQLGVRGTPGVFYRTDDGQVQLWRGAPSQEELVAVLGPVPD